jgi:hypothetical protein
MSLRTVAAFFFVALIAAPACTEPTPALTFAPPAAPAPAFPAVTRPAEIYVAPAGMYDQQGIIGPASRFVFYDDGTFVLQFSAAEVVRDFPGRYSRAGSAFTLGWLTNSPIGEFKATAELSADSLAIRYNTAMQINDFVDGVYLRAR